MAGARDTEKMKQIAAFVTKEFKAELVCYAKQHDTTIAHMIRDGLKDMLGVTEDIGTQRKKKKLEEKVVGTYEIKEDGFTAKFVFLENGVIEGYENGKKFEEGKWIISKEGELHIAYIDENGATYIFRINKDRSLTVIAYILKDGKREDYPKEDQHTYKKIK